MDLELPPEDLDDAQLVGIVTETEPQVDDDRLREDPVAIVMKELLDMIVTETKPQLDDDGIREASVPVAIVMGDGELLLDVVPETESQIDDDGLREAAVAIVMEEQPLDIVTETEPRIGDDGLREAPVPIVMEEQLLDIVTETKPQIHDHGLREAAVAIVMEEKPLDIVTESKPQICDDGIIEAPVPIVMEEQPLEIVTETEPQIDDDGIREAPVPIVMEEQPLDIVTETKPQIHDHGLREAALAIVMEEQPLDIVTETEPQIDDDGLREAPVPIVMEEQPLDIVTETEPQIYDDGLREAAVPIVMEEQPLEIVTETEPQIDDDGLREAAVPIVMEEQPLEIVNETEPQIDDDGLREAPGPIVVEEQLLDIVTETKLQMDDDGLREAPVPIVVEEQLLGIVTETKLQMDDDGLREAPVAIVMEEQMVKMELKPLRLTEPPAAPGDLGTGLLVDLSDAQPVKLPTALLMTAEMDDTFGIFSNNVQPRSYSTPNCLSRKKVLSSSSISTWDSPSFLVNLNDAFVKGSSGSEYSVSTNNQTSELEGSNNKSQNLNDDATTSNQDEHTVTPVETSPSRRVVSEADKDHDGELGDDQSNVLSPIVKLEESSVHEDKTSVEILDASAESEIFDLNNVSVFTADESDISDYLEMRDANFKKINLDFGLNTEAHKEDESKGLSRTPSPTTILRTPSGRSRTKRYPSAPGLGSSKDVDVQIPVALKSSDLEQTSTNSGQIKLDSATTLASLTDNLFSANEPKVPSLTPAAVDPGPVQLSQKKRSPFPSLAAVLKSVDEIFNVDFQDPEWVKKRKARERLTSLPSVLQDPEPKKTGPVANKGSLASGVDKCSDRTFVASSSTVAHISKPEAETREQPDSGRKIEPQDAHPTTPESKSPHEIGTPFRTPPSNKFKPTPRGTPLSSNSSTTNARGVAPIQRLSFSSSSSSGSGSDSCKRLSLAKPSVFGVKPLPKTKPVLSLSARGGSSEFVSALKINPVQKPKPSTTLQPLKATMSMTTGTTSTVTATAPAPGLKPRMVCGSAPVTRKFIPPVASSSPKPSKQPPTSGPGGIPSPRRKSYSVKSSGYGQPSSSLNVSRVSLNTSIPSMPPSSPKFIPTPISLPSPRVIPPPRAIPSPIRTRVSNSQLPTRDEIKQSGERRSMSIGDIPAKIAEQPRPAAAPDGAKMQAIKNKENKPKGLQRFGFRK